MKLASKASPPSRKKKIKPTKIKPTTKPEEKIPPTTKPVKKIKPTTKPDPASVLPPFGYQPGPNASQHNRH